MRGEGIRRQVDRRAAAGAAAPQQGDELGRGQAAGTARGEPLARPFRGRQLADGVAGRAVACVDHRAPPRRARSGRPRDPNDGSPPIPPAIRIPRTTRSLSSDAHRTLTGGCTVAHRVAVADATQTAPLRSGDLAEHEQDAR